MKKYTLRTTFFLIITLALTFPILVFAKLGEWSSFLEKGGSKSYDTTVNQSTVSIYVANILLVIPILGFVFIIHMVLAGYEWMTAAGDSKKVEEAQKRIKNAIIGLVLFFGAYAMIYFIVSSLGVITGYTLQ
ncbi:MAG: hypothetical protein WCK11_04240 [Candidatus Falkowbacteria bacterium]